MKAAKGDIAPLLAEVTTLGEQLTQAQQAFDAVQAELVAFQLGLPNLLHDSVPDGVSENDNVEIRTWGEPKSFDAEVKDHIALGALQDDPTLSVRRICSSTLCHCKRAAGKIAACVGAVYVGLTFGAWLSRGPGSLSCA